MNAENVPNDFYIEADFFYNPEVFGQLLNQHAEQFFYCSFDKFLQLKTEILTKPKPPNKPIYSGDNLLKKRANQQVYLSLFRDYKSQLKEYEKRKKKQDILSNYDSNFSGYALYMQDHKLVISIACSINSCVFLITVRNFASLLFGKIIF